MMREQLVPAFIAGLIEADVPPETIVQAVGTALANSPLGHSITGNLDPLAAEFAFEQAARLNTAL